jgi:hypothetical protein
MRDSKVQRKAIVDCYAGALTVNMTAGSQTYTCPVPVNVPPHPSSCQVSKALKDAVTAVKEMTRVNLLELRRCMHLAQVRADSAIGRQVGLVRPLSKQGACWPRLQWHVPLHSRAGTRG